MTDHHQRVKYVQDIFMFKEIIHLLFIVFSERASVVVLQWRLKNGWRAGASAKTQKMALGASSCTRGRGHSGPLY